MLMIGQVVGSVGKIVNLVFKLMCSIMYTVPKWSILLLSMWTLSPTLPQRVLYKPLTWKVKHISVLTSPGEAGGFFMLGLSQSIRSIALIGMLRFLNL